MKLQIFISLAISVYFSTSSVKGQELPGNCNITVAEQCFSESPEYTWISELLDGNLTVLSILDIDKVCSSYENIYLCIGSSISGCYPGLRLAYYTASAAARFLCNEGKQGYILNSQCLLNATVLSSLQTCTRSLITYFPASSKNLTTDQTKICRSLSNWTDCMLTTVIGNCDRTAVSYMKSLISATILAPRHKQWLYTCTLVISTKIQEKPITETASNIPQTTTDKCDINGTSRCLRTINLANGKILQRFITGTLLHNLDITAADVNKICRTTQEALYCIGTKLDACSAEILLLRDIGLAGTRYICNMNGTDKIGCFSKATSSNSTRKCWNKSFGRDIAKYLSGKKNVFSDKMEFCRLVSGFTSCYMDSVSSLCSPLEYNFVYRFEQHTFSPLKSAIGCDVLSGQEFPGNCNITVAKQCVSASPEYTWISELLDGNITVLSFLDIDKVCSSFEDIYYCIGSSIDGCYPGLRLAYYTAVTAARFLCNEGKQGYILNSPCLLSPTVLSSLQTCTRSLIENFPSSSQSLTRDQSEICRSLENWSKCMLPPVIENCGNTAVNYIKSLISATTLSPWHKQWLQCNVGVSTIATEKPTVESTANIPTTNTGICDIKGTIKCLRTIISSNGPILQWFTPEGFTNITATHLNDICMSLQDAYYCIGTKLDACSAEILLLRDVVLAGTRFICNMNVEAFLDNIGCFSKVAAANSTRSCLNASVSTEISQYFTGEKNVFSEKIEFCRLASGLTSCYMDSVSSLCSQQEYNFMYHYQQQTYRPLKNTLDCNVLSGRATMNPFDTTKLNEPTSTPKVEEPEPTNDTIPTPTPEIGEPEPTPTIPSTTKPEDGVCSSSPCYNGGTCSQHLNGFKCECPSNMFGVRCEIGVHGCPGYPCLNGGSCLTDDNGPKCLCPGREFPGPHCETESNMGPTTTPEVAEPETTPESEVEPTIGQPEPTPKPEPTPEPEPTPKLATTTTTFPTTILTSSPAGGACISSPCYNGGTCSPYLNGFKCACPTNMFGLRCEIGVHGCPGYPCFNGGSCLTDDNGPKCSCPGRQFSGPHCEAESNMGPTTTPEVAEPDTTPESEVEPTIGQPEPTPKPEPTPEPEPTPKLSTTTTTFSTTILTSSPAGGACISSPCYNGGTCSPYLNGFKCTCPTNMFGLRCEIGVNGCPGYPCFNGGSCLTDDNGPKCTCPGREFPGPHCEALSTTAAQNNTELTATTQSTSTMAPRTSHLPTSTLPPTTSTQNLATTSLQPSSKQRCRFIGFTQSVWRRRRMNHWCKVNCNRGYCPSSLCRCDGDDTKNICYAIGIFRNMVGMSDWCNFNCKKNYCPRRRCKCKKRF